MFTEIKSAHKIFKEDCKIDFNNKVITLHSQVRGLSPHPTAFFEIQKSNGEILSVKVYKSSYEETPVVLSHAIFTDQKNILKISGSDGFLHLLEVQLPGKKRMKAQELLRGFKFEDDFQVL